MTQYLPMLVMRTRYVPCAVELNGTFIGEVTPEVRLTLPLSDTGDYYIGLTPLIDDERRYYSVMRKLRFEQGDLQVTCASDVQIFSWPGGVYELVISPGVLEKPRAPVFPYHVAQISLQDGRIATLYYENGLCLAIEDNLRILYGAYLGDAPSGTLMRAQNGFLIVTCNTEPKKRMLVFNSGLKELLRIEGDVLRWEGNRAVRIDQINTQQGYEKRSFFTWQNNAFVESMPEIGFFTHEPVLPQTPFQTMCAFCEAVRESLFDEAYAYVTPSLKEELDEEMLKEFFGNFIDCREPLIDDPELIGLVYQPENQVYPIKLFAFSFADGLIDNVSDA